MNGPDKALIEIGGRPLIAHVHARLGPQVERVVLNVNTAPERFAFLNCPIVADDTPDFPGPLAGIIAGLAAADTGLVVFAPCDSPLLPLDLVARLSGAIGPGMVAAAASGERIHPVFSLWRRGALPDLRRLLDGGERRMTRILEAMGAIRVSWPDDPFLNLNTPEDCRVLTQRLADGD